MRRLLFALCILLPTGVLADTYTRCTKAEAETIARSVADAKRLAVNAAAAVGDTPTFETWFGKYSPAKAETVRRNLKNVVNAIRSGTVTTICQDLHPDTCEFDMYAYVFDDAPYRIHICPEFFSLPNMARLRPGQLSSNFGTRAGTIVHEITHFNSVANTDDVCYARDVCADMAQVDGPAALLNADSYQYFAEDVTYFRDAQIADKPAPFRALNEDN